LAWGSACLGAVIGWITYYTMRKNTKQRTLADITVIISALIGPTVVAVFPAPVEGIKQTMFGYYGIGLAVGFFMYYIIFVLLLWKAPKKLLASMTLVPAPTPDDVSARPPDTGIMGNQGDKPPGRG
jgi:glycopeptide antibiotics resistance protein